MVKFHQWQTNPWFNFIKNHFSWFKFIRTEISMVISDCQISWLIHIYIHTWVYIYMICNHYIFIFHSIQIGSWFNSPWLSCQRFVGAAEVANLLRRWRAAGANASPSEEDRWFFGNWMGHQWEMQWMENLRWWEYVWYTNLLDFYSNLLGKTQANGCLANLLGNMMINHGTGSVVFPKKIREILTWICRNQTATRFGNKGATNKLGKYIATSFFFIIQHIQKTYNVDFTVQIL